MSPSSPLNSPKNKDEDEKYKPTGLSPNASNPSSAFLQSMTFANRHTQQQQHQEGERLLGCDCDECGVAFSGNPHIPNAIQKALMEYRQNRDSTGSTRRTQQRSLVQRDISSQVSLWQWILPTHAIEPLLEFGTSHRLVYVQRIPSATVLKQIGTGIVGSSKEEAQRQVLDWRMGNVYWIPSRQGKAVGWVLEETEQQPKQQQPADVSPSNKRVKTNHDISTELTQIRELRGGPAVLYVLKVPMQQNTTNDDHHDEPTNPEEKPWYHTAREVLQRVMEVVGNTAGNDASNNNNCYSRPVTHSGDVQWIKHLCRKST